MLISLPFFWNLHFMWHSERVLISTFREVLWLCEWVAVVGLEERCIPLILLPACLWRPPGDGCLRQRWASFLLVFVVVKHTLMLAHVCVCVAVLCRARLTTLWWIAWFMLCLLWGCGSHDTTLKPPCLYHSYPSGLGDEISLIFYYKVIELSLNDRPGLAA